MPLAALLALLPVGCGDRGGEAGRLRTAITAAMSAQTDLTIERDDGLHRARAVINPGLAWEIGIDGRAAMAEGRAWVWDRGRGCRARPPRVRVSQLAGLWRGALPPERPEAWSYTRRRWGARYSFAADAGRRHVTASLDSKNSSGRRVSSALGRRRIHLRFDYRRAPRLRARC